MSEQEKRPSASRVRTIHVTLDRDYRADDVEEIVNAIEMIRGVEMVELGDVVSIEQHTARNLARLELTQAVIKFIHGDSSS